MITDDLKFYNALQEVQNAAHSQDLTEPSKVAQYEREAEQLKAYQPNAFPEPVKVPDLSEVSETAEVK